MLSGGRHQTRGGLGLALERASMKSRTIFPSDEELGKRNDDHKPGTASWAALRAPLRWRKRRIFLGTLFLILGYLFIRNIPDLGEENGRRGNYRGYTPGSSSSHSNPFALQPVSQQEPTGLPPGIKYNKNSDLPPPHVYDGQIRFYQLSSTLRKAADTLGHYRNRNVLFAISNLKSATVLLPLICEMARWNRNWVHVAFMGREAIPIPDLLNINGVDRDKCPAFWHDARPDYSEYSSEGRAEGTVAAAMDHIQAYTRPQVVITDDSIEEDAFFVRGMRAKAKALDLPIIEVPKGNVDNFMWIARLDAGSLKSWHLANVDILIQAPARSSGGLIRLLQSIRRADYSGLKYPKIIVELPAEIDSPTLQYLQGFVWPPTASENPLASNQLVLRRRIANHRVSPEEASIRFLESFYPTDPANSHVLLLSAQTQLSPLFYQYIRYTILEYKYSLFGAKDAGGLMGISLELPTTLLDGVSSLKPPGLSEMRDPKYTSLSNVASVPFLQQAPNTHAALYYGDKWVEFHSFLTNRVAEQHRKDKTSARTKSVSETLPAWAEYILELMRARGYYLLYPGAISTENLVTIHNELYQLPEEFTKLEPEDDVSDPEAVPSLTDEPFLTAPTPPPKPDNHEAPLIPPSRPLHLALPFDGDLPEILHMPHLSHTGEKIEPSDIAVYATAYVDVFRERIGRCPPVPEGKHKKVTPMRADDLFCFGDEDEDDMYEEDAPVAPEPVWDPFGTLSSELPTSTTSLDVAAETSTPADAPATTPTPSN